MDLWIIYHGTKVGVGSPTAGFHYLILGPPLAKCRAKLHDNNLLLGPFLLGMPLSSPLLGLYSVPTPILFML
jgi:hypothetical protein